jgi:hypothetical protein
MIGAPATGDMHTEELTKHPWLVSGIDLVKRFAARFSLIAITATIVLAPALALCNTRVVAQTGLSHPEPPPAFFALPTDAPAPRGIWWRGDSAEVARGLAPQARSRIYAAVLLRATPLRYGLPVVTYGLLADRHLSDGIDTDVAAGDSLILAQAAAIAGFQGLCPHSTTERSGLCDSHLLGDRPEMTLSRIYEISKTAMRVFIEYSGPRGAWYEVVCRVEFQSGEWAVTGERRIASY